MASQISLVLLAGGSFNPITHMHLRLFEVARDAMHATGRFRVKAGILSPVHDAYGKEGLQPAKHRLAMCKLAVRSSDWMRTSDWECKRDRWSRTVEVLRYIHSVENNTSNNAVIAGKDSEDTQVKLVCGADLLESFASPGVWSDEDIEEIAGKFGIICITRHGYDPRKFIYSSDLLWKYQNNIHIVTEWVPNEISATCVRRALRRGQSIKYLIPDVVSDYIYTHNLYVSSN